MQLASSTEGRLVSAMVRPRKLILSTIVGLRSQMEPIDFEITLCIFKVTRLGGCFIMAWKNVGDIIY